MTQLDHALRISDVYAACCLTACGPFRVAGGQVPAGASSSASTTRSGAPTPRGGTSADSPLTGR